MPLTMTGETEATRTSPEGGRPPSPYASQLEQPLRHTLKKTRVTSSTVVLVPLVVSVSTMLV